MKVIELLENITKKAFKNSWVVRQQGNFLIENHKYANFFRSAKFVSEVAYGLWDVFYSKIYDENHKLNMLHVQEVDDFGIKKKGEWLFDICITDTREISENKYNKEATARINTNILWAVESESSTSILDFCADFGKLICSGANNCFYLHGLNQRNPDNRRAFVDRRLSTLRSQLSDLIKSENNYYIGFWPSPKKIGGSSIWDQYTIDELDSWINVHSLNN
jgi:hypothetical protein